MERGKLIEECFYIKPAEIVRTFLWMNSSNFSARKRPDITYWMDNSMDIENITVCVSVKGEEPQHIGLAWLDITYGARAYFLCPCCKLKVSKLYLPQDSKEFKCRKCHKLQYFLTTFNKNSVAGKEFYKMNKMQKLAITRENMSRILYRGNYTKKFSRFIGLCQKAGLHEIVKNAEGLMELIKG